MNQMDFGIDLETSLMQNALIDQINVIRVILHWLTITKENWETV
jgi:hypothetical protein